MRGLRGATVQDVKAIHGRRRLGWYWRRAFKPKVPIRAWDTKQWVKALGMTMVASKVGMLCVFMLRYV